MRRAISSSTMPTIREAAVHLRRARGARGEFGPTAQHLVNVVAAAHERIQHRERILHNHRHAKPTDLAEFASRQASSGRSRRVGRCLLRSGPAAICRRSLVRRAFFRTRIRRRSQWFGPARRRCSRMSQWARRRARSIASARQGADASDPRSSRPCSLCEPLEQPVADQIHADRGQDDHRCGQEERNWIGEEDIAVLEDHATPIRRPGFNAEAKER